MPLFKPLLALLLTAALVINPATAEADEAALISAVNSGVNGLISGQFDGGQALKNAAIAALTAALSTGVGDLKLAAGINPGSLLNNTFNPVATLESALLHGGVGCVSSALSGQSCGSGFVSGSISDLANALAPTPAPGDLLGTTSDLLFHGLIGGLASKLAGGDFATGALNATLEELFNQINHSTQRVNADPNSHLNGIDYNHEYQGPAAPESGSLQAAVDNLAQTVYVGTNNFKGFCSEWVINALKIAGYDIPVVDASNADSTFIKAGFTPLGSETLDGSSPSNRNTLPADVTLQPGDLVVIVGSGKQHVAMFNGTKWVSDSVQTNMDPYPEKTVQVNFYRPPPAPKK